MLTDLFKFFKLISAFSLPLRSSFSIVDGMAPKNSIAWNALNLLSFRLSILKMNPRIGMCKNLITKAIENP